MTLKTSKDIFGLELTIRMVQLGEGARERMELKKTKREAAPGGA